MCKDTFEFLLEVIDEMSIFFEYEGADEKAPISLEDPDFDALVGADDLIIPETMIKVRYPKSFEEYNNPNGFTRRELVEAIIGHWQENYEIEDLFLFGMYQEDGIYHLIIDV